MKTQTECIDISVVNSSAILSSNTVLIFSVLKATTQLEVITNDVVIEANIVRSNLIEPILDARLTHSVIRLKQIGTISIRISIRSNKLPLVVNLIRRLNRQTKDIRISTSLYIILNGTEKTFSTEVEIANAVICMQAISKKIAIAIRIQRTILHVANISTYEHLPIIRLVALPLKTTKATVTILLITLRSIIITIITFLSRDNRSLVSETCPQVSLSKETRLASTKP